MLTRALVDEVGDAFGVLPAVAGLADAERTTFSGRLGAGICNLYMYQLGYVWQDSARNVIPGADPLADFLYDDGAGHGVVLTEAKGSVHARVTAGSIKRITDVAYDRQVWDHIGKATRYGDVVHGYVVGTAARTDGSEALLHVAQTVRVNVGVGKKPSTPRSGRPSPGLTLGNYRAVFLLAGASRVVSAIDLLRRNAISEFREIPDQVFRRVKAAGRWFLVGDNMRLAWPWQWLWLWPERWPVPVFAIAEETAEPFLRALTEKGGDAELTFELPVLAASLGGLDLEGPAEHLALFPDGFALLNPSKLDFDLTRTWSPRRGL
jgi:hypothetical protein